MAARPPASPLNSIPARTLRLHRLPQSQCRGWALEDQRSSADTLRKGHLAAGAAIASRTRLCAAGHKVVRQQLIQEGGSAMSEAWCVECKIIFLSWEDQRQ